MRILAFSFLLLMPGFMYAICNPVQEKYGHDHNDSLPLPSAPIYVIDRGSTDFLDSVNGLSGALPVFPSELISSFTKDSLLEAWYKYIAILKDGNVSISNDEIQEPIEEGVDDNPFLRVAENISDSDTPVIPVNDSLISVPAVDLQVSSKPKGSLNKGKAELVEADSIIFNFFIQIAASRTALEQSEIERLYTGEQMVEVNSEDGWYKYRIFPTSDYAEAFMNLYTVRPNVPDAFIVVYKSTGEKKELWEIMRRQQRNQNLEFRIQIAACREPIEPAMLKTMYPGAHTVREINEEGWYKYQIDAGSNIQEARETERGIKVENAFLVAYKGNVKQDLYRTIVELKANRSFR